MLVHFIVHLLFLFTCFTENDSKQNKTGEYTYIKCLLYDTVAMADVIDLLIIELGIFFLIRRKINWVGYSRTFLAKYGNINKSMIRIKATYLSPNQSDKNSELSVKVHHV